MKILHFTSIDSALSILQTRTFHPAQTDPLGGDAGLNAFDMSQRYSLDQNFTGGTDARLIFRWTGPVIKDIEIPSRPNALSVQLPHRVFVPIGTDQHLALIGFRVRRKAWEDYDVDLPWYCLTRASRLAAQRRILMKLRAKIEAMVADNPTIRVIA